MKDFNMHLNYEAILKLAKNNMFVKIVKNKTKYKRFSDYTKNYLPNSK